MRERMELAQNRNKVKEYRERARALVSRMTLEEKVGQTLHAAPAIQRLGIKAYNWWNEALHGVARAGTATVFPQAIGLAATFDEDFMEQIAEAISTEGRAKYNMQRRYEDRDIYKGLTFWSPNVNIFRDPRWGRGHETYGEDPYLSARLGVRFVQGIQGHDENYLKAAACAKHFAVHSGPEDIRHSFDAVVTKQDLYETYLPAFKACVQEGHVEAIMGAYNRANGMPCCGSRELLTGILRDEWGFEGHVVSDCWAIKDFHTGHCVTATPVESVSLAMNSGCDLNCGVLFLYLQKAIEEGRVKEERLDEALVKLFTARMKLGFFDECDDLTDECDDLVDKCDGLTDERDDLIGECDEQAGDELAGEEQSGKAGMDEGINPYDAISYEVVDSAALRALNLEAALRSVVLLKNKDNLLPLDSNKIRTIGVIGPNANNRKALVGNYEGTASRYITVLEGIQDHVGGKVRVLYSEGCHLCLPSLQELGSRNDRIAEVKEVCGRSDVIIACMGLDSSMEGEEGDQGNAFASGDKTDLDLPGLQQEVLEAIYESGRPVVLVLLSGSALAVNWAEEHIPAIVQGWYPGTMGGKAIAEILFGEKSPEGRLPVTFYRSLAELPDFIDYSMKNRTYRYMRQEALYPFGYGLSYTEFTYESVTADTLTVGEEGVTIRAVVKNTGRMRSRETVQAYVKIDRDGTPNAQLKGIRKICLEPGEAAECEIQLTREAFGLYDEEGKLQVMPGRAEVTVGGQAPDGRSERLTGRKVTRLALKIS